MFWFMINKVNLCGYVGQDPETRVVGGTKVARVSLATSKTWRDRDGKKQSETTWHHVVVWGTQAEVVERYVRKGSLVQVFGELTYRSYDDRDGVKRVVTEVKATEVVMMPSGGERKGERVASVEPDDGGELWR